MEPIPKISVITVVYNSVSLLERTMKSVFSQTYSNIEYIIVDGASTDGTMKLVERYGNLIQKIISEKDKGIYDAMNKGLKNATGDYVMFLNAGDEFYTDTTLAAVFSTKANADVYYGNTIVVNEQGGELGDRRLSPPTHLTWKSFKLGMSVSHQSFIAKRNLCNMYDLQYSISADIDWVITILRKSKDVVNVKTYISKFLEGGMSSNSRNKALKERFKISLKHYGFFTTIFSHFIIVLRFISHKLSRKSMT